MIKFICLLVLVIYGSHLLFVPDAGAIQYKYPENNKVLVYAASYSYGGLRYVADKSFDLFNQASFFDADLPEEKILTNGDASLEVVKTFGDYGTVFIHTHGMFWQTDESLDDWRVGIAGFRSGTEVQIPPLQRNQEYMQDLENFRLIVSKKPDGANKYQYVVMPSYIEKYIAKLNDTFFLLNYCHSLQTDNKFTLNNMMWQVLNKKGAKVAFGYSDEYLSDFGLAMFVGILHSDPNWDEDDPNMRNEYGIMYWMLPRENYGPIRPYTAAEAFFAIPEEQRISYTDDVISSEFQAGIFQKKVASPEWDNFIFKTEPEYVVIKVGESSGSQFFTVWDPVANAVADIYDPVNGNHLAFPAEYADLKNWLAERSTTVTTQAYTWQMENNALKRIGESWQDIDLCTCTVDPDVETTCSDSQTFGVFSHPGCGDYQSYCNYSQTLTTVNGDNVWDTTSEGRVYVDKFFWETILGSFAPVVNTNAGTGEAACLRSEWYQYQTIHSYLPEASLYPFNEWEITQPIKWITPIGEMDLPSESYGGTDNFYSYADCPSTTTWSMWNRDPSYSGDPIAKPIIYASYGEKAMVQLYYIGAVHWSGTQQEDEFMVNGQRECQVTAYEESYVTDNRVVAGCSVNQEGANALDPRTQPRNPEFESAVRSLVDHTINMQKAAGEITDTEVFKGGIKSISQAKPAMARKDSSS
jgi:hypothetical protein